MALIIFLVYIKGSVFIVSLIGNFKYSLGLKTKLSGLILTATETLVINS